MENTINVCLACDDNYVKPAGVVIASIIANKNCDEKIHFYILDGGISNNSKDLLAQIILDTNCSLDFIEVNNDLFVDYLNIKTHKYISIATFYRLKIATLLPDLKKLIYLDCDTVVNSSLREFFDTNLEANIIAGVRDINKKYLKKHPNYVNAGVLLFDLEKIRSEGIELKFLDCSKQNLDIIKLGDQDIINEVLKGKIKIVDDEWNVQSSNFTNRSSYTDKPKIVHFVAKNKPWHMSSYSYHKNLYFQYLQLTPWQLDKKTLRKALKSTSIKYFKYRPLFLLRPRFYKALYYSYIKPFFESQKPIINNNTFLVWEPCSKSHSEVVPGYVQYLLDLGYHVSILLTPDRYKEGLFARFENKNVSFNTLSQKEIRAYFKKSNLNDIKGLLVTTVGKLCDEVHFDDCYKYFAKDVDKTKIFFVEHEAKHAIDASTWRENLITLRELNYKDAKSVVVNPHYFGNVKITSKNNNVINFITVGAIQGKKKNNELIINSVRKLHDQGYRNFKVTVIGKGELKNLPKEIQPYFDIKGRLDFDKMYDEIEKSDYMLTSYNENNPKHQRYITTGTSGNFQLVYGFLKPCLIIRSFAAINGFNDENSILYDAENEYSKAMERAINLSEEEYTKLQENLAIYQKDLYKKSLENLKELING